MLSCLLRLTWQQTDDVASSPFSAEGCVEMKDLTRHWRWIDVALRIISAVPLGYAVASVWAMALARTLPGARSEATVTGTLVAFALCAFAAMYAFAARSGSRAFCVLIVLGAIGGGIAWTSITTGHLEQCRFRADIAI